ncbi:hypothetical protein CROQUDRAFT_91047 [Cronartium quercuum f. sp. fusiforme G11]|uniref:Uncharacterized protein n=1 Tax=Cronartium quercuum f. sp. fusiforme G11 TaxID=708437 RepID=A0A9P6NP55_9BASI|nr:hypothetical protein CROQUDRAFT_91047 [Cronartium quercuum f. sp. fusiforme G11]
MSGGIPPYNFPSGQAPRAFQASIDVNGALSPELANQGSSTTELRLSRLVNPAETTGDFSYDHTLGLALSA